MNEVIPGYSDLPLSDVKLQQWLLKHLLLKAACYSGSERRAPTGPSLTRTHIPNVYSHLTKTALLLQTETETRSVPNRSQYCALSSCFLHIPAYIIIISLQYTVLHYFIANCILYSLFFTREREREKKRERERERERERGERGEKKKERKKKKNKLSYIHYIISLIYCWNLISLLFCLHTQYKKISKSVLQSHSLNSFSHLFHLLHIANAVASTM